jgi:subtilisin family serine protease
MTGSSEIHPYDDVRRILNVAPRKDPSGSDLSKFGDGLATLSFNQGTAWPAADRMPKSPLPAELLESALDPGLGVRDLHRRGITGKGVSVAIIDQPLYRDHPEFAGKIVAYNDTGCNSKSSMHGPAVASLLAGNRTGVAPDVRIYYAAVPSWLGDAGYFAKALDWILAQNRNLPTAERIRVVSVSAAPSGKGSPFTKNTSLWDEAVSRAEAEGVVVLDCTAERGIIGSCWFRGPDRNKPGSCVPGYPGIPAGQGADRVLAPTSPRTTAEQYAEDQYGYVYWGRGGLSWAIPYAAGVLALRWQARPEMTAKEAVDLLRRTAEPVEGGLVIHPVRFVSAK